jgi:hypothetical protein
MAMDLILSLLQQICVYLVLAYMLSKTPIFLPLLNISSSLYTQVTSRCLVQRELTDFHTALPIFDLEPLDLQIGVLPESQFLSS